VIEEFLAGLKTSMEQHSRELKHGALFHPKGLEGKKLTGTIFPKIASNLAGGLGLRLEKEISNPMPKPSVYKCGKRQIVDYVFRKGRKTEIFLELESLDRAQLYLFWEHEGISEKHNENKLWYYYGTLAKFHDLGGKDGIPRYFVWLLILPEHKVGSYPIWDVGEPYSLFHPSVKKLIYENPFRFYDPLIKTAARKFLQKKHDFRPFGTKGWITKRLTDFQDVCELIFITCTGDRLVMSRGKDRFSPSKEISLPVDWKGKDTG
jgi:hypothetical protein